MDPADANLRAAERIVGLLHDQGIPALVIGAVALAAYKYVRHTEDIDLGVDADILSMRAAVSLLRQAGFTAELREPSTDDPLGGVIDVSGPFGLVQIISFGNRFPAAIRDALVGENILLIPGGNLRIIPLPQLVALKLYAGGIKAKADIVELLRRNPDADFDEIRKVCRRYRLRGLAPLLRELED